MQDMSEVNTVDVLSPQIRKQLVNKLRKIIQNFSGMLRELEIKKQQLLENIMKHCGTQWEESKLKFAISEIKTNLYRLRENINEIFGVVDRLTA